MMKVITNILTRLNSSSLIKNSFWGLSATFFQSVFLSLFFIILARKYSTDQFADFLIATSIYQIVVAFSSMGLGQWFIREYNQQPDRILFLNKFLKIQLYLGGIFYLVNIGLAYVLYPEGQIRLLILILGINILLDNLIYSFRNLNIAESFQSKSAQIFFIDGFLRLAISCVLFVYPISIVTLTLLLLAVRLITINSFIRKATTHQVTIKGLLSCKISINDIKEQILQNWHFVVIGSLSILFGRISNIIISKFLLPQDVVNYEIAFKIFTLFLIIPSVVSASLFPLFIKHFNSGEFGKLRSNYQNAFSGYLLFAMLSYAFVYSFADAIVPFAFGDNYSSAVVCVKLMFLSFVLFPTILLQANLIIAMKMERSDMIFNFLSLVIHLAGCFVGLYFIKSLDVINYSVLISFISFHILQDALLIRKGMTSIKKCVIAYTGIAVFIFSYQYLTTNFNPYLVFLVAGSGIIIIYLLSTPKLLLHLKQLKN